MEMLIKKIVSIFVFATALFVGVFLLDTTTPTIYEKLYPAFSEKEAMALLGRRVKNKFSSKEYNSQKCTLKGRKIVSYFVEDIGGTGNYLNACNVVKLEEMGTVVALEKVPGGYFLVIKWDETDSRDGDFYSFDGRYSARVFSEFQYSF